MTRMTATRNWTLGLAAGIVFLCAASGARAQSAGYMRVVTAQGPIAGASKEAAHLNWIPLTGAQISDVNGDGVPDLASATPAAPATTATKGRTPGAATNPPQTPRDQASGMATGKRMHKPLTITKEWDASSPLLRTLQANGTQIPSVEIHLPTNTGAAKAGHYKLSNVMISSIQVTGGGGKTPQTESVTFTYQKIEWTY